jgi:hypothetical protein
MIVLINLKDKKLFIENCFEKDSKVSKDIMKLISISRFFGTGNKVPNIFCNIFLDQYKEIFFIHKFDDLFIFNNEKFTKINVEGLDKYPKIVYQKVLNIILDLEFTYEDNLHIKDEDERPASIFEQ